MGAESKLEAAATITGKVTVDQKIGFQVVGSIFDYHNYDGIYDLNFGGMADVDAEVKLTLGAFVYLEPAFMIYGMAGFDIEPRAGLYLTKALKAELLNGVEATQIYAKWDLKASAELNWTWNDYLARFSWAEEFQNKLNRILREKKVGVETSFTLKEDKYYLFQQKPPFLSLVEGRNIQEEIFTNEDFSKTYSYKVKNTGDEQLIVNTQLDEDLILSNYVSVYPTELNLNKDEEGYISVNVNIPSGSLTNARYQTFIKLNNSSESGINSETGSREIEIDLAAKIKLEAPESLNLDFTGEGAIKELSFSWNDLNQNVDGIKIYKSDFNISSGSCSDNFLFLTRREASNNINLFYNDFEEDLEAGKKYCFKVALEKGNTISLYSNEVQLTIPAYGSLISAVKDHNNNPIVGATIRLTILSNATTTDQNGNFVFSDLIPGKYRIVVERDGYEDFITEEYDITVGDNSFEQIVITSEELQDVTGTYNGKIKDATTSGNVEGATINIREGRDNTTGTIIQTLTSDSSGNYSIDTLSTGYYTFNISKDNYITASENILIVGNETNTKDLSISPILSSGEMRIKLSWGQNPSDLDSHLVKKTGDTTNYHIFYSNRTGGSDGLDTDDTSSYGPETTTISNLSSSSIYTYYVHHYGGSGSLKDSSAKVEIYYGDSAITYNVPNEDGIYWKVFEIENGVITPCTSNCVKSTDSSIVRSIDRDLEEERDLFKNLPSK